MQRFYIGLVGKQGSGKNTVAEILKDVWEPRVMGPLESSLAYSLKKGISVIFDVDEEVLFNAPSETKNNSMVQIGSIQMPLRILMQRFGTECMRTLAEDIHVDLLMSRVNRSPFQIIVIPDIRFPNEADFVRKQKGLLVRVNRKVKGELSTLHASEKQVDSIEVDLELDNNLDHDSLTLQVYNSLCPLVPKDLFKESFSGFTPVNMESLKHYMDMKTWKDVSMKEDSFYFDVPTSTFQEMLGGTLDV